MADHSLLPIASSDQTLANILSFESALLLRLEQAGLPTKNIFVDVEERGTIFQNVDKVLKKIHPDQRARSTYVSKFLAAVGAGLFDAALNYLWDETVNELRIRIEQYDLSYFYDNAGLSPKKRADVKDADDLEKLDDSQLVAGARAIELISELGTKQLDLIRHMRNWASAAHPNHNELTGLQLISWLETCIKEVISLPLSNSAVEIKKLLGNLRGDPLTSKEAQETASFFLSLTQDQANSLASGLFGIATEKDSTPDARQNVRLLIPKLWPNVDEETRRIFGFRYGKSVANNDVSFKSYAHDFLVAAGGLGYLPTNLLAEQIDDAIDNLIEAHEARNNFYNEPSFARALRDLVPRSDKVPPLISEKFVRSVVAVYLTNGYGKVTAADPIYTTFIEQFSEAQAMEAVLLITNEYISRKLQFPRCATQFLEMLILIKLKITSPAVNELVATIHAHQGDLSDLRRLKKVKLLVDKIDQIRG